MSKKNSIAIVEDNLDMRRSISTVLTISDRFQSIFTFGTAEEYLASLRNNDYNFVLMDITLPGKDGIYAIEESKKLKPESLIIIISLHDDDSYIFRGICAGASGYLSKPIQAETLLKAIEDVAEGGTALSPLIASRVVLFFKQTNSVATHDYKLSKREKDVLSHLIEGNGFKEIADHMNLSLFTIRAHIRNIYKKLHVHSKSQAVSKVLKEGFLR